MYVIRHLRVVHSLPHTFNRIVSNHVRMKGHSKAIQATKQLDRACSLSQAVALLHQCQTIKGHVTSGVFLPEIY